MNRAQNDKSESRHNDYEALADSYQETDVKPDKRFSILPTTIAAVGILRDKTVVDLGCGSGFFTRALAASGATKVIGLDNSEAQLKAAHKKGVPSNIEYRQVNIFSDSIPKADIIVAPFVANYPKTVDDLKRFLGKLHEALNKNGKLFLVVDLPTGADLKKYGAVKRVIGPMKDGSLINIELYDGSQLLVKLSATYFKEETFENFLEAVGFSGIRWEKPIVAQEGYEVLGDNFWHGYIENPELGYISANKR